MTPRISIWFDTTFLRFVGPSTRTSNWMEKSGHHIHLATKRSLVWSWERLQTPCVWKGFGVKNWKKSMCDSPQPPPVCYLSLASLSVIASVISSQSLSRELSVFWTVWLIVFSMVRQTSSSWLTQRLGCQQEHKQGGDAQQPVKFVCTERARNAEELDESRLFTLFGLGM